MTFLPSSSQIIGIEITSSSFRIAKLKKKKKNWHLVSLEEIPLEHDLKGKISKNHLVVTAIPSSEILVRPLDLPLKKEKDLEAAYPFQAESLLPYPLEKGVVQKINIKTYEEGTSLTILAAKKDHVERHLQFLKEKGISPCVVTGIAPGLATLSNLLSQEEPLLVIQMGEKEGTLALIEKGKLITARAFEIEKSEIQKSVLSILNAYKTKKIETIWVATPSPEYLSLIEEATQKNVAILKIPFIENEALQKFGGALSIAFAATEKNVPNFLSKEERYFCSLKKAKRPLLAFFSLAAALFITFSMIENKVLKDQEKILLNRSRILFEAEPASLEELAEKLERRNQEIEKLPDTFPLLPQVPQVSDVIAHLTGDARWMDENGIPTIVIEDFHYTMHSRPSFERKNEKYLVKVELIFEAENPNVAHAFHEALASYSFVDNQKEIEWVAAKGKYRTSFFLKDKTRYS